MQADNHSINLTCEEILMLQYSDEDIIAGRLISQEQLDINDLEWLSSASKTTPLNQKPSTAYDHF